MGGKIRRGFYFLLNSGSSEVHGELMIGSEFVLRHGIFVFKNLYFRNMKWIIAC